MNVILLGYRGSGKSTAGRSLAQELGLNFVDVDKDICARFGNRTVAEIWATDGEPRYRKVEVEVTRDCTSKDGQVIALGGGTLMQPGAREAVDAADDTVRIYLKASPQALHDRVTADKVNEGLRPALGGFNSLLDEIESMLEKREPTYTAVADFDVNVEGKSPEEVVAELLEIVRG